MLCCMNELQSWEKGSSLLFPLPLPFSEEFWDCNTRNG